MVDFAIVFIERTIKKFYGLVVSGRLIFAFFFVTAFIVYSPVLMKSLAADDYHSVYRVATTGNLFPQGFFRPLSDLTLLFNYKLFGFQSWAYNCLNLIFHIVCSFTLYLYTLKATWFQVENKRAIAFIGSLLFLIYPFHSEAIVWCVGRGASLAMMFALFSLLSIEVFNKFFPGLLMAGLFYVVGLTAYESILPLPAMLLMVIWWKWKRPKKVALSFLVLLLFTFIYFLVRFKFSNVIIGSYASGMEHKSLFLVAVDFIKAFCRLFLPPCERTYLLILFSLILVIFILVIKRRVLKNVISSLIKRAALFLFVSLLPAAFFSLSSHTTEGDRLLYFPSIFICIIVSYVCFHISKRYRFGVVIFPLLAIYCLTFTELTNITWQKSSEVQNSIIDRIADLSVKGQRPIYLLNIPDELDGAYIFRNGFYDALLIHGIDTTGVIRVNRYLWDDMKKMPKIIKPKLLNDTIYVYPDAKIYSNADSGKCWNISLDSARFNVCRPAKICLWNQQELLLLKLDF